jgi:hypothetical protein
MTPNPYIFWDGSKITSLNCHFENSKTQRGESQLPHMEFFLTMILVPISYAVCSPAKKICFFVMILISSWLACSFVNGLNCFNTYIWSTSMLLLIWTSVVLIEKYQYQPPPRQIFDYFFIEMWVNCCIPIFSVFAVHILLNYYIADYGFSNVYAWFHVFLN